MKNWLLARGIELAIGLSLIPILWFFLFLGIFMILVAGLIFTAALIVAPGQVKVNGIKLYKLTRRKYENQSPRRS